MSENKPFAPSKKKLRKARKEGNVKKSQLLTQAGALGAGIFSIYAFIRTTWVKQASLLKYCFINSYLLPGSCIEEAAKSTLLVIVCFLLITASVAVVIELRQVGFMFEVGILAPKADRFSPGSGIKKIWTNLSKFWWPCLQLLVVVCCIFILLQSAHQDMLTWMFLENGLRLSVLATQIERFIFSSCIIFVCLGIADYFLKSREFFKKQSMTFDEVKRENKESEGDPFIRSQRRALHEDLLSQDVIEQVKKAKVIVIER